MPLLSGGRGGSNAGTERVPARDIALSRVSFGEEYRMNALPERSSGGGDAAMRSVMRSLPEDHTECGNAGCRSGWTFPWKNRRHPIFEERWACSGRCLLEMVKAAIAREVGDGRRDGVEVQHQHRVPLGLVMLAQGWISHPQLQRALEAQRAQGVGRIGDWLVSECGLEADWVTRGLSMQWGCPVLTTDGFSPSAMAMALPRVFIERYGILPLKVAAAKILYVGFEDHLDASSAFALEQMSGLRTESGLVQASRFREARERLLECEFAPLKESAVPDLDALAKSVMTIVDQRQTVASRLVRLREYYWLRAWTRGGHHTRGGNLPAKVDDAADYLFTIGRGA
jgi:hypothetical protein